MCASGEARLWDTESMHAGHVPLPGQFRSGLRKQAAMSALGRAAQHSFHAVCAAGTSASGLLDLPNGLACVGKAGQKAGGGEVRVAAATAMAARVPKGGTCGFPPNSCPPASERSPMMFVGSTLLATVRLPAVRLSTVTQFDGTPRARVHMADEVTREQILKDLADLEDIKAEDLLVELRVVQAQAAASEAVFAVASAGAVFAGARAASMSSKMSREQKEEQSTALQTASLTRGSFLGAAATGLAGAALGLFFGSPAGDQTGGATSGARVPADGALVARLQRSEAAREAAESKLQARAVLLLQYVMQFVMRYVMSCHAMHRVV